MSRGPEQTQGNRWDIKEGVDDGALLSEAVCNALLFSAQLSCGVIEESRRDTGLCHGNTFKKSSMVPRWSHLVVYKRRW